MEPTESTTASALTASADDLSPLEQDVLDEYERLAENLKKVLPRTRTRAPIHVPGMFAADGEVAGRIARHHGWQTDGGNPGWIETVGTEDQFGVYVAEGERL